MDFTIVAGVLGALLLFIPALTSFLSRSTRRTRKRNRQLEVLAQEALLQLFAVEQLLVQHGVRPPVRPEVLRVSVDDEDDGGAGAPAGGAAAADPLGPAAGGGPRHGAP